MRSEFKRLFMGFIYSLMTFSFIMAPIPVINLAYADDVLGMEEARQNFDYTGGEGRKKIYKKGEDFDETREKATLQKYAEENGGLQAIIQQLTVGMMGITLLNAIKYKYTHEANPILYGNDCGINKAAKFTIRAAQLGSLLYIIGDVTANFKYSKSARLATEEFEKSGWNPEEKKDFENMSDEEKEALAENDKATDAAEEQNDTLQGFDTMIGVLKDKESAVKTKRALAIAASIAYGLSTGFELANIFTCKSKCSSDLGVNTTAMGAYNTAMTTAYSAVGSLMGTYCATSWTGAAAFCGACTALQGQLVALDATVKGQISKDKVEAAAVEAANIADDTANTAESMAILAKIPEILTGTNATIVGDVTGIMQKAQDTVDAMKTAQETVNAANDVKLMTQVTKDQAAFGPIAGTSMSCPGSTFVVGTALSQYLSYAYSKIECCGGAGTGSAMEATFSVNKRALALQADTLSGGQATLTEEAKLIADKAAKKLADELADKAVEQGKKAVLNSLGGAVAGDFAGAMEDVATEIAGLASVVSDDGTYAIQGVPLTGTFARKQDITLGSLFGGGSSSSSNNHKMKIPKADDDLPSDFYNVDEGDKFFVKNNFESVLRRFAEKAYLSTEYESAKKDAQFLMRQEQEIKNIMFFFDQMIDESSSQELANNDFTRHRYWDTIQNLISNLIMPKAHALGISGMAMGGMAIRIIAPMLGLPPEWTEVLNIGSNLMMLQGLLGAFAKRWALVKPIGRTATWAVMTTVLLFVQKFDKDAIEEINKRRKAVEAEKNKWLASAPAHNKLAGDDRERNKYASTDYESRSRNSTQSFIQKCAVPSGGGFKPANCPTSTTKSSFDLGKGDPIANKLLTPSHLKGMSTISNLSSQTANGTLPESALEGSNLAELERMNNAIAAHNNKLIDYVNRLDEKQNKKRKKKAMPLSSVIGKLSRAFNGGNISPVQGNAIGNAMASAPSFNPGSKDESKDESGVVEATTGSAGSAGGPGLAPAPSFDLDLLGDDAGGVTEDGSVADGMGAESEKKEENLADFEINHDDINKKKEVSIFKILSNRYILSYPKVLEEEVINEQNTPASEVKKE